MVLQSIGFQFFANIMKGSCVFYCSSCIKFNPTSQLNVNDVNDLNVNDVRVVNDVDMRNFKS